MPCVLRQCVHNPSSCALGDSGHGYDCRTVFLLTVEKKSTVSEGEHLVVDSFTMKTDEYALTFLITF